MKISSIFNSIDGEVNWWGQGTPTTFIRFQGCNLRCSWCDTPWAQDVKGGVEMSIDKVVGTVIAFNCPKITITGGEPLMQGRAFLELIDALEEAGCNMISIETNGSYILPVRSERIAWVIDYKLPSSGVSGKMLPLYAFSVLSHQDFIKMVIMNDDDFDAAKTLARYFQKRTAARIALGCGSAISPTVLLKWMKQNQLLDCVANFQLHKLLAIVEDGPTPLLKKK